MKVGSLLILNIITASLKPLLYPVTHLPLSCLLPWFLWNQLSSLTSFTSIFLLVYNTFSNSQVRLIFLTRAITVGTWPVSLPPVHLPPAATMMVLSALLKGKPGALPHLSVKPGLEPGISHVFDFPPPTCHCWSLPLCPVSMHNYHLWFHGHVGAFQVARW